MLTKFGFKALSQTLRRASIRPFAKVTINLDPIGESVSEATVGGFQKSMILFNNILIKK